MKARLTFAFLFVTVVSGAAFAQQTSIQPMDRCATSAVTSEPIFLSSNEALKLQLEQLRDAPETGDTGAAVTAFMLRSGLKSAWVRVQVLVNERGQVQGVQNIEGTPAVLSAAVREVQRYRFKPYAVEGSATPFVTVLNVKFAVSEPPCSLTNPKACR